MFYNDSEAIISRISAHCPEGQTFLSEKHLKEFASHIQSVKMIQNMKVTLAKNLLRESKLPTSLEQLFNPQLLKKLRLIVTGRCNSSRHQLFMREKMKNFSKMKLVKTFPRISMTSERLSNNDIL